MGDGAPQADGYFPRLNGAMMKAGTFANQIVSVVGHFENSASFRCSDGVSIQLSTEHLTNPDIAERNGSKVAVELVGQVSSPEMLTAFVARVLSEDTDVAVYDRMLAVRNKPAYQEYFAPVAF